MRILMVNREKNMWQGGDYFQLEETAKALRSLGHEVEISEQAIYTPAIKYRNFDLIHAWNFSMPWTPYQLGLAFMYHKPTVCSMIYHDREDFVKFTDQQDMANRIDEAIFLNKGEVKRFKDKLEIDDKKISIIPNGIDQFWFKKVKTIDSRPYVLTVGRVEPHKGQLAVAKACKELGIKYLMVGENIDTGYLKECEDAGAIWEDKKTKEELIKIYANCACFVLNSKAEVQPLTIMEAGAQAKNIVRTKGCLWDVLNAFTVDCDDIEQLKEAISLAMVAEPNKELRDWLKEYTWEKIAKQLEKIYKRAVKKHKNEAAFSWGINK